MTSRDFTAYAAARREEHADPVTFTLDGETYEALSPLPGGVLLDAIAQTDEALALTGFFDKALVPGDWDRLRAALADPAKPVTFDVLTEIFAWLMEVATDRPTQPSGSSQSGRSDGGSKSKSASRRRAQTG